MYHELFTACFDLNHFQLTSQSTNMQLFLIIATVLSTIIYFAHGQDPSAGSCGPTSIPNVPGCWGTPVGHSLSLDLIEMTLTMIRDAHMSLRVI